jgi:hypothetical protein
LQTYAQWELCLIDGESDEEIKQLLHQFEKAVATILTITGRTVAVNVNPFNQEKLLGWRSRSGLFGTEKITDRVINEVS